MALGQQLAATSAQLVELIDQAHSKRIDLARELADERARITRLGQTITAKRDQSERLRKALDHRTNQVETLKEKLTKVQARQQRG